MKIIPVFFITVLLVIGSCRSANILDRNTNDESQVDFENDANYNFTNSKNGTH